MLFVIGATATPLLQRGLFDKGYIEPFGPASVVKRAAVAISQDAVGLIEGVEGFRPNFYTINGDKTIGRLPYQKAHFRHLPIYHRLWP